MIQSKLLLLSILTIIMFPISGFSQEAPPIINSGYIVKGKITDATTQQAVEYATVAIYKKSSNTLITGIATDVNGHFVINDIKEKEVYITVTFMGYKPLKIEDLPLPNNNIINLNTIDISPSTAQLDEITVVAQNKSIDYQLDKKVIDVASQSTAASATAIEVLQNVPSVKVDIDGTVSLRGSSGFTVLIDGKPTPLDASDALRSIPSSSIQKIEIITNPSAKYEPDGTSGIVNVILKKNRSNGFNGAVNTNIGINGSYGGDILLNLRRKKVNYNLGADFNKRMMPGTSETERIVKDIDTIVSNSHGNDDRNHRMMSLKGGVDLDLTDRDALSFGFRVGNRKMENDGDQNYNEVIYPSLASSNYSTYSNSERGGGFGSINTTYLRKFATPGRNLTLQADYNSMNGKATSLSEEKDDLGVITNGKLNTTNTNRREIQTKADYVHPFANMYKFETGYQGRYELIEQTNTMDTLNTLSNVYEGDPKFEDNATYIQNIHALYGTFSKSTKTFSYQLGIRGEYTYRDISTTISDVHYLIDKWDIFPTLHLSYNLPSDNKFALSYARRIERTRGWDLNPFVVWVDNYNVRQGNPELKNQYIDAYELGYIKEFDKVQLSLEGFYRITNNKIERLKTVYSNNVIMQKPYNVGKDYSLGLEASATVNPLKFWELILMGSLSDYTIKGELEGTSFDNNSFNWNSRLNNTFHLSKNQQIQITTNYNSKTVTSQGYNSASYAIDAAYKLDFLQKQLSFTLQARDIFLTDNRESFTETPTIYSHNLYKKTTPYISLTATYRINNYRPKKNPSLNGGNSDMGED